MTETSALETKMLSSVLGQKWSGLGLELKPQEQALVAGYQHLIQTYQLDAWQPFDLGPRQHPELKQLVDRLFAQKTSSYSSLFNVTKRELVLSPSTKRKLAGLGWLLLQDLSDHEFEYPGYPFVKAQDFTPRLYSLWKVQVLKLGGGTNTEECCDDHVVRRLALSEAGIPFSTGINKPLTYLYKTLEKSQIFYQTEAPSEGDVAIFFLEGKVTHYAVFLGFFNHEPFFESKFGQYETVVHPGFATPLDYGDTVKIFTKKPR